MKALWDSPLGTSGAVRIAEPLAYVPELKLLVQGPIPEEQTLQELIESALHAQTPEALANLDDYMHKTAVGLAELHSSNVCGNSHSWEDELTGVRAFVQRLTAAVPNLAAAATSLFACIESLATMCPPDPQVPAHGTFRPTQVLLAHEQIGFIDFDSFCQAEPAIDLALFMVATMDTGMSAFRMEKHSPNDTGLNRAGVDRLVQLESIADRFLAHYEAIRPVSRQRVAVWEALNMLELVVRSWDRVKPMRLNHTIPMLERHLRAHLS
jgi:aminoglycoside phosphotransferase (APT) family kinase protein